MPMNLYLIGDLGKFEKRLARCGTSRRELFISVPNAIAIPWLARSLSAREKSSSGWNCARVRYRENEPLTNLLEANQL